MVRLAASELPSNGLNTALVPTVTIVSDAARLFATPFV